MEFSLLISCSSVLSSSQLSFARDIFFAVATDFRDACQRFRGVSPCSFLVLVLSSSRLSFARDIFFALATDFQDACQSYGGVYDFVNQLVYCFLGFRKQTEQQQQQQLRRWQPST
jgi:hypothetical protein